MQPMITISTGPAELLRRLEEAGYETYVVGGCVRDSLRGVTPSDWDLCTSARPEQTTACFAGERVVPTGIRHGTVTVVLGGTGYEITTYRTEGGYADHRHPDRVEFVGSVAEDLSRRDFTINAMAFHPAKGLCDPFGGREDLSHRVIRCVGEPRVRFEEDALRILRALRFASQLDFTIDPDTARAVRQMAPALCSLPGERVGSELKKLLCGPGAGRVLLDFWPVFCEIIPDLKPLEGAQQDNPHHCYTMDRHTAEAVNAAPPLPEVRLCMLFHDIAKPLCRTTDTQGVGHYKGHPALSAKIAAHWMQALRIDRATKDRVCLLVRCHDERFDPGTIRVKQMLRRLGPEALKQLLWVQRADAIAKGDGKGASAAMKRIDAAEAELERILREGECYSLADLAVGGQDLLVCGLTPGPDVGRCLDRLLDKVIQGELPNRKEPLLDYAKDQWIPQMDSRPYRRNHLDED